jgi:hypothetical protein
VPSPSAPTVPRPQHLTAPVLKSAQTWSLPDEIAVTPELKVDTDTGLNLLVCEPSPS